MNSKEESSNGIMENMLSEGNEHIEGEFEKIDKNVEVNQSDICEKNGDNTKEEVKEQIQEIIKEDVIENHLQEELAAEDVVEGQPQEELVVDDAMESQSQEGKTKEQEATMGSIKKETKEENKKESNEESKCFDEKSENCDEKSKDCDEKSENCNEKSKDCDEKSENCDGKSKDCDEKSKDCNEKIVDCDDNVENIKRKKHPYAKKIIIGISICFVLIGGIVGFFVYRSYNKLNFVDYDNTDYGEETFDTETDDELNRKADEEIKEEQINFDEVKGNTIYDENVINILCVGDDQKASDSGHGNSDSIIILSINKKLKTIKVASIMRDLYVPIGEGYRNNKINAAYNAGGINLLKGTIERNFKIPIDGALVVHFDTFPELIDKLGGVKATLNQQEAEYINGKLQKDGMVSNLTSGNVFLDGNQTLWFSRIRKISSDIYGQDDFGRTCRQRHVLDELFDKYKTMSYMDMYNTVDTIVKIVDIDKNLKDKLFTLARIVSTFNADKIENMRIPLDGAYTNARVYIGSNSVWVLNVSSTMQKNVDELHMFLYGNNIIKDVSESKVDMEAEENKQNSVSPKPNISNASNYRRKKK